MNVYVFRIDPDLLSVTPATEEGARDLACSISKPCWPDGYELKLRVLGARREDNIIYADSASLGSGMYMCLSPAAQRKLSSLLKYNGRLVDTNLENDEGRYRMFFPSQVIPALVLAECSYKTFADSDDIMSISRYSLAANVVAGHPIFRIQRARPFIFVTDSFKDLVEESQLIGFFFTKVWSSEEGPTDFNLYSHYQAPIDRRQARRILAAKRNQARRILAARPY